MTQPLRTGCHQAPQRHSSHRPSLLDPVPRASRGPSPVFGAAVEWETANRPPVWYVQAALVLGTSPSRLAGAGGMRGWFPWTAEQKVLLLRSTARASVCKRLQPRMHLRGTPLTRQGPKTQTFRGKRYFWKRNRELELGEAKAPELCCGWTSGAASSSTTAAKWNEKKLLKPP